MKSQIRKLITEFYTFHDGADEFPSFPAKFIFDGQKLRTIFPAIVSSGTVASRDTFIRLFAAISRDLGIREYADPGEVRQLLLIGLEGKELHKGATSQDLYVQLFQRGDSTLEVEFVSKKL